MRGGAAPPHLYSSRPASAHRGVDNISTRPIRAYSEEKRGYLSPGGGVLLGGNAAASVAAPDYPGRLTKKTTAAGELARIGGGGDAGSRRCGAG